MITYHVRLFGVVVVGALWCCVRVGVFVVVCMRVVCMPVIYRGVRLCARALLCACVCMSVCRGPGCSLVCVHCCDGVSVCV